MLIRIKEKDGAKLFIPIPTGLVANRLTAHIAAKGARKYGVTLTGRQISTLFKAIRRYKKAHPDWIFVEVQDADGDYVMVKL